MKALLLVGGTGKRLRRIINNVPKPMAPVGGVPFLEFLVLQLRSQGFEHLLMCTSYLSHLIEQHFGDGSRWQVNIEYSQEPLPLGTAGALKFASSRLASDQDFIVLNGDSFLGFDFRLLVQFHRERSAAATLALLEVPDTCRYGTVEIDSDGALLRFREKNSDSAPGLINGGVYVLNRRVLDLIAEGEVSLEKDTFPALVGHGLYGLLQQAPFVDIGVPEDYEKAQKTSAMLQKLTGIPAL